MRKKVSLKKKKISTKNKNKELYNLTKTICTIIHKQNKKFISDWLTKQLSVLLDEIVCNHVEQEFKKDILPILLKHVDSRIYGEIEKIKKTLDSELKKSLFYNILVEKRKILSLLHTALQA